MIIFFVSVNIVSYVININSDIWFFKKESYTQVVCFRLVDCCFKITLSAFIIVFSKVASLLIFLNFFIFMIIFFLSVNIVSYVININSDIWFFKKESYTQVVCFRLVDCCFKITPSAFIIGFSKVASLCIDGHVCFLTLPSDYLVTAPTI